MHKTFVLIIVIFGNLLIDANMLALSDSSKHFVSVPENRISFYQVPLRCPLVDGLGCGSAAKPVLEQLERKPSVATAWLNHSGTRLAVEWKKDSISSARAQVVAEVSQDTKLNELSGRARKSALRDIRSSSTWYRRAKVDDLSRQEAETVARRIVDKVGADVSLPQSKRNALEKSLAAVLKRKFIEGALSDKQAYEELLKAGRVHLEPNGMRALEIAIQAACCPSPTER